MRNRWLSSAAVVVLLAGAGLLGVACSSDDADEQGTDQGTGGTGGETPDAGDEPDADDQDAGPDAEADAKPDADEEEELGSEQCGTVLCEGVATPLGFGLDGCCAVEADEACGLIVPAPIGNDSCVMKDQAGVASEDCPEYDLPTESGISALPKLPGCCTPAGTCGFNTAGTMLEALGISLGCVDPADVGVELDGGTPSCTYEEPGDPDAGTDPDADTDTDADTDPDADPNP